MYLFILIINHGKFFMFSQTVNQNLKNCRINLDLRCYCKNIRSCFIITCLPLCQILTKRLHSGRLPPSYHSGMCTALDNNSNTVRLCSPCSTFMSNAEV